MDEQTRKKVLVGGLAAVVLVFLLRSMVDEWVRGPIRDLQSEVAKAEASAESLTAQEIQLDVAKRNLDDWKAISLPPDVDNAQRLYREWIQALTEKCGFSRVSVIPASKSTQKEFSTVAVEVRRAETDLEGLTRFLYLFDQADLLHRISAITIDSPSPKGNPRLEVSFTAEGMSATGAEDRTELLPRTPLTNAVKETDTKIVAVPNEAFLIDEDPEKFEPFLIRIGHELLRVESVSESGWKVTRGMIGTKAISHDANAVIELFPVAWNRKEFTKDKYDAIVKSSLFVIPAPPKTYTPRLSGVSDKTIKPGEELKFTARADSLDPELGEAQFALSDSTEGMAINPASGEFTWKPPEETPPGEYTATVLMSQSKNAEVKFDSKLKITIRKPNAAPKITLRENAIVVLEKEFTTTATATDDDAGDKLTFSLGGGSPEGLTVDAKSGLIKWTPVKSFTPGKYDVEVKVTDSAAEPKTTSAKIALDVQDDFAKLTFLTGVVGKDRVLFAWFHNRATDRTTQLKEGEELTVSDIRATIISIGNRHVTMKDEAGLWKLNSGHNLRDRELVEPAAKSAESPTIETTVNPAEIPTTPPAETPAVVPADLPPEKPVVPAETPPKATAETPASTEPAVAPPESAPVESSEPAE